MPIVIATYVLATAASFSSFPKPFPEPSNPDPPTPLKAPKKPFDVAFKAKLLWEVFPARSKQPASLGNLGLCGPPVGLRFSRVSRGFLMTQLSKEERIVDFCGGTLKISYEFLNAWGRFVHSP